MKILWNDNLSFFWWIDKKIPWLENTTDNEITIWIIKFLRKNYTNSEANGYYKTIKKLFNNEFDFTEEELKNLDTLIKSSNIEKNIKDFINSYIKNSKIKQNYLIKCILWDINTLLSIEINNMNLSKSKDI